MRGSVSWKITTCNCSRVAPSYGKICTAIGVRIWKRSPAWRERRDEMTSAMQAAAQDFTIPLQPIERSPAFEPLPPTPITAWRSEEHTSELQSLMRISSAVFCLKKNKKDVTCKIKRAQPRGLPHTNQREDTQMTAANPQNQETSRPRIRHLPLIATLNTGSGVKREPTIMSKEKLS